MNKNYVIALGREFCSGGREIGKMIAERLGINYYDKEELRKMMGALMRYGYTVSDIKEAIHRITERRKNES